MHNFRLFSTLIILVLLVLLLPIILWFKINGSDWRKDKRKVILFSIPITIIILGISFIGFRTFVLYNEYKLLKSFENIYIALYNQSAPNYLKGSNSYLDKIYDKYPDTNNWAMYFDEIQLVIIDKSFNSYVKTLIKGNVWDFIQIRCDYFECTKQINISGEPKFSNGELLVQDYRIIGGSLVKLKSAEFIELTLVYNKSTSTEKSGIKNISDYEIIECSYK